MSRAPILLTLACAAGAVALALAPPVLHAAGFEAAAGIAHAALAPLCHQDPARSLHLAGSPLGVCARCFGLYAGFLLAGLAAAVPLLRARPEVALRFPSRAVLAFAALPMAVQWGFARLPGMPWWLDANAPRLLTGAVLGAGLAPFILPAVVEMAFEIRRPRGRPVPQERRDVPAT